ncbi:ubiquitin 3 binding protein But2 C-terminal domain-domain-containing protein [Protomyces lactucae-debilis]|uniref:Ubiquitin 3 binding protein But2 C-terminal domain-domain-containing protein n=1 Tax=Protomyces lactucae-debilis TaxID=2754530 RepID=A0A1Y2F377_PROLT|nr:ubiquitin 3 binding protein But2 C-terminal domain-containing protein [Protomyces lactucae-debilis]ORY78137.1 ubiquitin 3 binding protein But2 C-terminal domain-domain-containing protein [Protomyces lactucae-debilis]
MKFSSFASLGLTASLASAQSNCSSTQSSTFVIQVNGCGIGQIDDGQVRAINISSVSQIADGQVRCALTGTGIALSSFTLTNGCITDNAGRTCEISNQSQLQCQNPATVGASTTGFSVCSGMLAFNGKTSFLACLATGALPGYNLYTVDVDRSTVTGCILVELLVPVCPPASASCVASTLTLPATTVVQTVTIPGTTVTSTVTPAAQTNVQTLISTSTPASKTVVQSVTSAMTSGHVNITASSIVSTAVASQTTLHTVASPAPSACFNITNALGSKSYPRTILGVSSSRPNDVIGMLYIPQIGGGSSSVFTFDFQQAGTCSINFLFPTKAQIQALGGTTDYTLAGGNSIDVTLYQLASVATDAASLTYSNKPVQVATYTATLTPGQNTTFATFACPVGKSVSYELAVSAGSSSTLSFFEDYNPPPMGLVLGQC